ncbi:hypothetical protein [Streptococcus thoraltensis]|uniref:hypothetical protein n=1 Tax=Streptococcus thoraltensis TaxID=55085 RepID=UPI001F573C7A|nr:hypothetical protein [Streptococcus thoraltensis]
MSKKRIFNYFITVGFILWAIICIYTNIQFLISIIGLGTLLTILTLGNYFYHFRPLRRNKQNNNIIPLMLFFIFLFCELVITVIMLLFADDISLKTQKILACLLCFSIFWMVVAGYKYEDNKFQDSKTFSESRYLGIAINPKHPIGRIIYVSAFIFISIIFLLLLFFGPIH